MLAVNWAGISRKERMSAQGGLMDMARTIQHLSPCVKLAMRSQQGS